MCLCCIHEPLMSNRVFLNEWIFQQGYYHGHCMDTSTRVSGVFPRSSPLGGEGSNTKAGKSNLSN